MTAAELLKPPPGHVETQGVKICPKCEAELRDSVIRCVRCGHTVRGDEERLPDQVDRSTSPRTPVPAAAVSTVWGGTAAPATPAASAPLPAPSEVSRPPLPRQPSPAIDRTPRRALPTKRAWGPDPFMLLAGLAAAAAGALAYLAIKEPWVHLTITREANEVDPAFVATMSLRGKAAFVGTADMGLAIALGVLGVIWFVYGFQRGWTVPGAVNPAFGLLLTIAGLIGTALASMVWFVWQDAMVVRAKAADMTPEAMRELLDFQPSPLVQIQRLSGLLTFGGMMVLGFLASCLGYYAYRRREG